MTNKLFELSNEIADAAEKAGKSIVLVNARQRMPASGIVFAPDLIVTADHVIENETDISVMLPDGTWQKGTLAGRDPGLDLAVIKIENKVAHPAETGPAARVGELVLAIARPGLNGIEASLGTISAINGPIQTNYGKLEKYYRTDTTPFPGFSGGGLVNVEGNIIGLNTSGFGHGLTITIPASITMQTALELAQNGSIKRGYLGIRSQAVELTTPVQEALKRQQASGLLIVGLEKQSPAETGGLLVGDILVGIEGHPLANHDDLFANLSGNLVGKQTSFEVLRGGQPMIIGIVITERKAEPENHEHPHSHKKHRP